MRSYYTKCFLSLLQLFSTTALASVAASVSIDEVAEWQQPRPGFRSLNLSRIFYFDKKYLNKYMNP